MGKIEIFYFTGTGNSLAVAKDLAVRLNAKLTPVETVINQESITSAAEVMGFIFPIYDFKPPKIFNELIPRITNLNSKYLFAVCTYGIAPNKSLHHLNGLLHASGGTLAAGFAVRMPHNAIGSGGISLEDCARDFRGWKSRVEEVSEYLINRRKGQIDSTSQLSSLLTPRFWRGFPELLIFLQHIIFKGAKSLAFVADENCRGCGICQRICPVKNIELSEHKPRWADRCTSCFACLQWCPNRAIRLGDLRLKIKPYHHPEIKIVEMLRMDE